MTIGEKLKKMRGEETQMSFGKRVGVTEKTVRNWETGNTLPDLGQISRICKQFDMPLWVFFHGVNL